MEETDLAAIDRVLKMFNIQYEADDIPAGSRLYSLTVAMADRYISDNLLTKKELAEHIAPYMGRKGPISTDVNSKAPRRQGLPDPQRPHPGGEIILGYELTIKGEPKRSIFRFPRFGRKKAAKPARDWRVIGLKIQRTMRIYRR